MIGEEEAGDKNKRPGRSGEGQGGVESHGRVGGPGKGDEAHGGWGGLWKGRGGPGKGEIALEGWKGPERVGQIRKS